MGFFSKMAEVCEPPEKKAFKKQLGNFPEFQSSKAYWSCDETSMLAFDETNTKLLLATNCAKTFEQRLKLAQQCPKGVKPDQYLEDHWWDFRVINYTDLISSEVVEDGNSLTQTSRTSQAAGAIVGGVLLGGAGAIIGGLSGGKRNINTVSRLELALIVNDVQRPRFTLTLISKEVPKNTASYKQVTNIAEEVNSVLTVLIRRADIETEKAQNQSTSNSNTSIADELTKLTALLTAGHITNEEYQVLKAKAIEKYS